MRWLILISIIISSLSSKVLAQESSCTFNYPKAAAAFELGNFEQAISLLTNCSLKPLSDGEKIIIHYLLIKAHYNARNIQQAEEQVKFIYKINPEYQVDLNETPGIQSLFFRMRPAVKFAFSFIGGLNIALPNITTTNTFEGNTAFSSTSQHTLKGAFNIGIAGKIFIDFPVIPTFGLTLSKSEFKRISKNGSDIFQSIETESNEADLFLQFETGARYMINKKIIGLQPYVELGIFYAKLLSSDVSMKSAYIDFGGIETSDPFKFDFTDRRRDIYGIIISTGIQKKVYRGNISFGIQFYKSLSQQVERDKVLENQVLHFSTNYFDNDFVMNRLAFVLGYEKYFFRHQ